MVSDLMQALAMYWALVLVSDLMQALALHLALMSALVMALVTD